LKRARPLLWPLLVGLLSLAVTAWLWQHERQTAQRDMRSNFDFGLRQTATRIEERLVGYEQMLRGARGLFEASDRVSPDGFAQYVAALTSGAGFAGLRTIAYAPLLSGEAVSAFESSQRAAGSAGFVVQPPSTRDVVVPVAYAAPAADVLVGALGDDLWSDPVRRAAMLQARDSGHAAITPQLRPDPAHVGRAESGVLLVMPLFAKGQPHDSVAARRIQGSGWVVASFRVEDLMASLYGENAPGLDIRLYDGVEVNEARRLYPVEGGPAPAAAIAGSARPPRFEAQEYIAIAGHTWTLSVRSGPVFEQRYGNDSAQIIASAGGVLSGVLALLTWLLVTGRDRANSAARQMTRQLRDSAERYRRMVDTADEGIWLVDSNGLTTFVNPKLQQLLGCAEADLLGRRWTDFMDDADRAGFVGAGHQPLPQQRARHPDVRFRRQDGGDLWASLSTSPILDESGQYAGALTMVTDTSEHKRSELDRTRLEGQLRQSQKMEAIGTMAGGIAHDFNNILAAILGNAALVRQDLDAGHPTATRLAQISQAGERGRSLVQQIAAFSRQQPQQLAVQALQPVLDEAARLLRSTLPAGVDLVLHLPGAPLWVNADATQLQQVLLNLCTNAWHAMDEGSGHIRVSLETVQLDSPGAAGLGLAAPGGFAHLQVSDDGRGMDEATRLRIFEPFFTTKPVGKGTGLGLSVVHGIVAAHGGVISVHSQPGHGSCFALYLPLTAPPAPLTVLADPAAAVPAAPRGQGQHVLYVDDDPVMGALVQALLARAGYRVSFTEDPRAALDLACASDDPVDLLVTDYNMPGLSGLDLVRELQRRRPGLPVVLSSGYVSDGLRQDAQRAGVRHLMQKEYTLEQLSLVVHQALTGRPDSAAG
jgi:PAS domain S-box-containing protein